jgi:methionine-S-sulfoxide reductase
VLLDHGEQVRGLPRRAVRDLGYCGGHEDNRRTRRQLGHDGAPGDDRRHVRSEGLVLAALDRYWRSIDPTQSNGQACDHGDEYRSAIFWHDDTQRRLAEASKQKLDDAHTLPGPIVTRIVQAKTFFPAEEYHQDFWQKNPEHYAAYREGCGRDRMLARLWGKDATMALEH